LEVSGKERAERKKNKVNNNENTVFIIILGAAIAAALDQCILDIVIELLETRKIFRAPGCS
jgi:hypothetical protein